MLFPTNLEVSESRSPLTVIVSGGFADRAGRFSLAEKHSLRGETAVGVSPQ